MASPLSQLIGRIRGQSFAAGDPVDYNKSHWVTIRGTHVKVGANGRIEKGPAHMMGRKPQHFGHNGDASDTDQNRDDDGKVLEGAPAAAPAAAPVDPRVAQAAADYATHGTRAPAFKAWFGDFEHNPEAASKVVGATGEPEEQREIEGSAKHTKPVPVYHGTPVGGWTKFDKGRVNDPESQKYGDGFYFTDTKSIAQNEYARGPKGHVHEAYLNIRKPFDIEKDKIPVHLLPERTQHGLLQENDGKPEEKVAWHVAKGHCTNAGLTAAIKSMGHDGLTHVYKTYMPGTGSLLKAHRVWVAFEPSQIKEKRNRGTFDPNHEDIMFSAESDRCNCPHCGCSDTIRRGRDRGRMSCLRCGGTFNPLRNTPGSRSGLILGGPFNPGRNTNDEAQSAVVGEYAATPLMALKARIDAPAQFAAHAFDPAKHPRSRGRFARKAEVGEGGPSAPGIPSEPQSREASRDPVLPGLIDKEKTPHDHLLPMIRGVKKDVVSGGDLNSSGGPSCGVTSEEVAKRAGKGYSEFYGAFHDDRGNVIDDDHAWVVTPTGDIIDPTIEQFGDKAGRWPGHHDVAVVPKGHPYHSRYERPSQSFAAGDGHSRPRFESAGKGEASPLAKLKQAIDAKKSFAARSFDPAKHPRGKPANKGQFVKVDEAKKSAALSKHGIGESMAKSVVLARNGGGDAAEKVGGRSAKIAHEAAMRLMQPMGLTAGGDLTEKGHEAYGDLHGSGFAHSVVEKHGGDPKSTASPKASRSSSGEVGGASGKDGSSPWEMSAEKFYATHKQHNHILPFDGAPRVVPPTKGLPEGFAERSHATRQRRPVSAIGPDGMVGERMTPSYDGQPLHELAVQHALKSGKNVPPHVMAKYPHLSPAAPGAMPDDPAEFDRRVASAASAARMSRAKGTGQAANAASIGGKAMISDVHKQYTDRHGHVPLDDFKDRLSNRLGDGIHLASENLVPNEHAAEYAKSQIMVGASPYHYVRSN